MDSDVAKLGKIVEGGRRDRAIDAERGKAYKERLAEVDEPPQYAMHDFWCTECQRDFSATGMKQVRNRGTWPIAWYGALCPSGHLAIRRITDKISDPYFHDSVAIRRQQAEHADDFILPSDPRFKYKYPVQWARIQEEQTRREEAGGALTT